MIVCLRVDERLIHGQVAVNDMDKGTETEWTGSCK